ncbi:tetratricopeptide (TPR) repeat protein [Actinoplanes campanulatus]|uniref:Tetratricopeptide (TPR) repeat protein n=1 Tax=Actinoplanes campanulatus TaxID=113559 RepID=A0A7W5ACR9_9ACTN|nr:CHAT domain-containing protein [Actinoplanes campanulatus]MBB3093901.1 tetratricopeptide (TPR) repeat protein [Actinoplanes campanulatus]GGN33850.1 hypothetical protein GCM10010109_56290 [Actinoplanes campanulatus]GID38404.1 hypothetical protein Aca09nite_49100 [Actinoplanes campanulatus]
MDTGLVVDDTHFEVLAAGARIGPRREIGTADEVLLADLGERYVRAVRAGSGHDVFTTLGRELWSWLDGDEAQLIALLDQAAAPLIFEVRGPRSPSARAWAVLRAPFELLAHPVEGFLAANPLSRFCVVRRLGRPDPLPEPDGFRLGLAFMASSPRRHDELDFEAEEAAILDAIDETRVDLVVEDTGNPVQLGRRLADLGGLPVVHLSCHGTNRHPGDAGAPVLLMEDEVGDDLPVTAAVLAGSLSRMPRLLFVSACLTATAATESGHLPGGAGRRSEDHVGGPGGLLAHSMATALVSAGVPAVLGWDGSVGDRSATLFARHLYARLSDHTDLAPAVGDAVRALLNSPDDTVRPDWHLARLWLGPSGGGRLVSGTRRRSRVSPVHGTRVFLDRKRHIPVTAPEMFVGRRPELQRALRALRSGQHAGVLLHGQGRLGKSSLAARIADRRPDLVPAVVFGDYSAAAILDAVAEAVRTDPAARSMVASRRELATERPEALEALLTDLLAGPCAQAGDGCPLLLIIDDLERLLQVGESGLPTVDREAAPVLAAVLRAFDPAGTDSRLLLTSRFRFALGGLEERLKAVSLRPLSTVAQHKLLGRQQARTSPERWAERSVLAERAVAVSRGNPGLQDLIGSRLVLNDGVDLARAEAVVAEMEVYLNQGELPKEAEVRGFLENLALDALLEQAGPRHRALLRDLTVFQVPVPKAAVTVLARRSGGSAARLLGLGLVDAAPDLFDPRKVAVAANALTAGRLDPLTDAESAELARIVVEPLFTAWGGADGAVRRHLDLELQLAVLALRADDPRVTGCCAANAIHVLRTGPAVEAFEFGEAAIDLLDRHRHPVPVNLLRFTADAARVSGDGEAAGRLLTRAVEQTRDGGADEDMLVGQARVLAEYGTYLIGRGELDEAAELLNRAYQLFVAVDNEHEAAVCQGTISDILHRRGEFDEVLRILRDIVLPVHERSGELSSVAACWSKITDVLYLRGEFDEALRICHEIVMPIHERLGDDHGVAVTWGRIADVEYMRGDYGESLHIRRDVVLPVYERLGDVYSTAVCWGKIADILYRQDEFDEVLRIRREVELPIYERLGDGRSVALCWGEIADVLEHRGELDEVLRIRRDVVLPVHQALGDVRSVALCWGKIAGILAERGEYDEALRILHEDEMPVHERLGSARSVALCWGRIADIKEQRGEIDEALEIRRERELPVYERQGDFESEAVTCGQIGDDLCVQKKYDEALTWQLRRLRLFQKVRNPRAATWARADLAAIHLMLDEVQTAFDELADVFLSFRRLGVPLGMARVGPMLGRMIIAAGEPDAARRVLDDTLAAAEEAGVPDSAAQARELLARLSEEQPG